MLFNYGLPEDGRDPIPDDADSNLIPELVEKVAIPILHHAITSCWDMLSTRETKNAVSATNLVINYLSTSSEALAELLGAVRTRLVDAVANVMVCILASKFLTLFSLMMCCDPAAPSFHFVGANMESNCPKGCANCSAGCSI